MKDRLWLLSEGFIEQTFQLVTLLSAKMGMHVNYPRLGQLSLKEHPGREREYEAVYKTR